MGVPTETSRFALRCNLSEPSPKVCLHSSSPGCGDRATRGYLESTYRGKHHSIS